MTPANELTQVSSSLLYWQAYDASVKADLFSTAVQTSAGLLLVDPIPLQKKLLESLIGTGHVAGIFVTNVNHCRAAADVAGKFAAPIFAHRSTCAGCELPATQAVENRGMFLSHSCAIEIGGAPTGEMAIHYDQDGGTLIVGDALINFEPYGFALLPSKYCLNAKEMRRSLRHLLDYDFERMLFAHGTPLMHSARKKLEDLLRTNE